MQIRSWPSWPIVAGHTSGYVRNYGPQGPAPRREPKTMLPSIRLVIAAIFATVVLIMGGFWLTSTFQIAKTSTGVPPRGSPGLDPALAEGSERKQIDALTGTQRINEISLAVDLLAMNTRVTATARFNHEDTVIEAPANNDGATGVINLVSPSRSDDSDQTASIVSQPDPAPFSALPLWPGSCLLRYRCHLE